MKMAEVVAALGLLCGAAGCGETSSHTGVDAGVLPCQVSAAQACSTLKSYICESNWSGVLTDPALCVPSAGAFGYYISDCGDYHLAGESGADYGIAFYYNQQSGALVAIVEFGNLVTTCLGGPSSGFIPPDVCTGEQNAPPPPQCIVDGGSDTGQ